MKIVLEPHADFVTVTIKDDEDARQFCSAACELMSENSSDDIRQRLKESYDKTAEQMVRDNFAHWHRDLWDYVIDIRRSAGVVVSTKFGAALLQKLGII